MTKESTVTKGDGEKMAINYKFGKFWGFEKPCGTKTERKGWNKAWNFSFITRRHTQRGLFWALEHILTLTHHKQTWLCFKTAIFADKTRLRENIQHKDITITMLFHICQNPAAVPQTSASCLWWWLEWKACRLEVSHTFIDADWSRRLGTRASCEELKHRPLCINLMGSHGTGNRTKTGLRED